ncbi:hypothetical protein [Flavobacterium sp.]|uniref:hypothetical protein n=1 Tax=Flavobacterium sp. TaxID=239 RepID=UPI004034A913
MKYLLRIIPVSIAILITIFKTSIENYGILMVICLVGNLIYSYKKDDSDFTSLLNYIAWWPFIVIALMPNGFIVDYMFFLLLILKVILLICSYFKFKRFGVPSTFFSKVWIIVLTLYLIEIFLNTTHVFKALCFIVGLISSIDSIVAVLLLKDWQKKIPNFYGISITRRFRGNVSD